MGGRGLNERFFVGVGDTSHLMLNNGGNIGEIIGKEKTSQKPL